MNKTNQKGGLGLRRLRSNRNLLKSFNTFLNKYDKKNNKKPLDEPVRKKIPMSSL